MPVAKKYKKNPILAPNVKKTWESVATFNGCPVAHGDGVTLLYRAMSSQLYISGAELQLSTIGIAESKDGYDFKKRRQLITPEYEWERFGCEDPRITKLGGKYYIFYTALSRFPFCAPGIRIAVAITKNLKNICHKYPVTTFNSKAMSLFPEKINGKFTAILTANTDLPPSKICIAQFDKESDIWSRKYWDKFYTELDKHELKFEVGEMDHIEVGAPPIKTKHGWLLVRSYIQNYFRGAERIFTIDAVLLDLDDPHKVLGRSNSPLILPEEEYELYGLVDDIVFPSGALIRDDKLLIYYGGADTTCCVASFSLDQVINDVLKTPKDDLIVNRYEKNPIITRNEDHEWERRSTFNPTAIYLDEKVHLLYRAMSMDNTSYMGYAVSSNGLDIDERLDEPAFHPTKDFEKKYIENGNSGCEDGRLVQVGEKIYMFYTAYNGKDDPQIAVTNIKVSDFLKRKWAWEEPKLISQPGVGDKDCAILPEKVNGRWMVFHRIGTGIDISFSKDLEFTDVILDDNDWIKPRRGMWDDDKVGIAGPPIKTDRGWLLLYHGISKADYYYRLGAVLLDLKDPREIIARSDRPIFQPEADYELEGDVNNVVFPCGAVVIKDTLYIYYGGADLVVGVGTVKMDELLDDLLN